MFTYEEFRRERESLKSLKAQVDRLCQEIIEGGIRTRDELEGKILEIRKLCEEHFPEKTELFNMVYEARFKRLWEQFGKSIGSPE